MKEACVLIFLGINSWLDIRKRQISLFFTAIFALAAFLAALFYHRISWEFFIPAGIGCFFIGISILSKGALGMGDGLILTALGMAMQWSDFIFMLFIALSACALWSGILLCFLKKKKNTQIPFVPFLMIGYLGGMIL